MQQEIKMEPVRSLLDLNTAFRFENSIVGQPGSPKSTM